jgi:hypothetical protein
MTGLRTIKFASIRIELNYPSCLWNWHLDVEFSTSIKILVELLLITNIDMLHVYLPYLFNKVTISEDHDFNTVPVLLSR